MLSRIKQENAPNESLIKPGKRIKRLDEPIMFDCFYDAYEHYKEMRGSNNILTVSKNNISSAYDKFFISLATYVKKSKYLS